MIKKKRGSVRVIQNKEKTTPKLTSTNSVLDKFININISYSKDEDTLKSFANEFCCVMDFSCDYTDGIKKDIQKRKKQLMDAYSNVKLPGFRQGKEPVSVVINAFGKYNFFAPLIQECIEATNISSSNLIARTVDVLDVQFNDSIFHFKSIIEKFNEFDVSDKYIGLELESQEEDVTEEEIEEEINRAISAKRKLVEKTDPVAEMGDYVLFTFKAKLNSEEVEKEEEAAVILGSHDSRWTDDFENAFVGKSASDEFDIEIVFPEDHPNYLFVSKSVKFHIVVNDVKAVNTPKLNDNFVMMNFPGCKTVDDFREKITDLVCKMKKKRIDDVYFSEIENKLMEIYDVKSIPVSQSFLDVELEKKIYGYRQIYQKQLDNIMDEDEKKYAEFIDQIKENILTATRIDVVLQNISNQEKIEITSEDLDSASKEYAYLQQAQNAEGILSFLRRKKTMEKIKEKAVLVGGEDE